MVLKIHVGKKKKGRSVSLEMAIKKRRRLGKRINTMKQRKRKEEDFYSGPPQAKEKKLYKPDCLLPSTPLSDSPVNYLTCLGD